jgi:hypothetical protein
VGKGAVVGGGLCGGFGAGGLGGVWGLLLGGEARVRLHRVSMSRIMRPRG